MKVEDDPYWGEAPGIPPALAPGDGSDVGQPEDAAKHNRLLRELLEIAVIVAVVFLGVRSAIQNFKVEGDSMAPTLHTEQYLLVNRILYSRYDANFLSRLFEPGTPADMRYLFQQPQRGDIVVFESPSEPRDFIKRIVAVAGETVEVRPDFNPVGRPGVPCGECGVYVNGVLLVEPYVRNTPDYEVPPTLVPPGHVFVLGDNRRNSADSHVFGPLAVERIVGVAFMSYLPTDTLGFIPHPTYAEIGPTTRP
jgi:signal peptidase I